jgi:hypothetical protein
MLGVGLPEPLIIFTLVPVITGSGKLPSATCLSNQNQNDERQVFLMA